MKFLHCTYLFCALSLTGFAEHVIHEKRDAPLRNAFDRSPIERDALLPMRIGLKPNKHAAAQAEKWIIEVSDPNSVNFGRHWTQDDVIHAFQPAYDSVQEVTEWLKSHGIYRITHSDNKQWIAFDATAAKAEEIFQTKYHEHQQSKGGFVVSCDEYKLPEHVSTHVDYITPGIKGTNINGRTRRSRAFERRRRSIPSRQGSKAKAPKRHLQIRAPANDTDSLKHCDKIVTPACIRALYNFTVPDYSKPANPNNHLGIFEQMDEWYQGDLDKLFTHYTDIPAGTSPIFAPIDGGEPAPTKPKGPGWDLIQGESDLDLQLAIPIIYPQNVTLFQTDDKYWAEQSEAGMHAGYLNTFLDAIDGSYCTYSAFNITGNSPIDPKYPDTHRGKYNYNGTLQCGVYKPTNVISISYGSQEDDLPYNYQRRQCNEFLKLGLQGVTVVFSSGDSGVGPCSAKGRLFEPDNPNGCPWVTNVGATQIGQNKTVYDPEEASSEVFKSGGGFSFIFDTPSYQQSAVDDYFKVSDPGLPYFYNGSFQGNNGKYNRNGRGYPDLAAVGNRIATWTQNSFGPEYGTSASAPIVASLFNRIVEERLAAGKGPIGFVNPTLYSNPSAFHDITIGNNREPDCGHAGFQCARGWDPVTGMGTPDYGKLLDVFMSLP